MPSGVLIVDKPVGMTSHDVVHQVRRALGTRRVGHAGTLDPDASGVLVVCVGDATRLLEYMTSDTKSYEGTITFGIATDTEDATGQVTQSMDSSRLTADDACVAARTFVGGYAQRVPAFSAVHIDGRRAYELARSGQVPTDLPVREVGIESFELTSFVTGQAATAHFRVTCSKGTYIRSLCRDLGIRVGLCAHMSSLRRTRSGQFDVGEAIPLADIVTGFATDFLLPLEQAVAHLPALKLPHSVLDRLAHGQSVTWNEPASAGTHQVLDESGRLWLMANVERLPDNHCLVKPRKVLVHD